MKKITTFFLLLATFLFISCNVSVEPEVSVTDDTFKLVFMTDIHVQPERNAIEGFDAAINTVNEEIKPDFVITGGDLIMDALGVSFSRADSLYNIYQPLMDKFEMPVYNTIGNHEIFGWYEKSGVEESHDEYGKKMFEKRLGDRYYSFDHKGWHFLILDSIEENEDGGYKGYVSEEQMEWIAEDLSNVDESTPICVSVHIPFFTLAGQYLYGSLYQNTKGATINNSKEVLDLFIGHNLKVVLQGHIHILEDLYINDIHFITGGAVSAAWWTGSHYGTEEGFLVLEMKADDFSWEYYDYGWEVKKN